DLRKQKGVRGASWPGRASAGEEWLPAPARGGHRPRFRDNLGLRPGQAVTQGRGGPFRRAERSARGRPARNSIPVVSGLCHARLPPVRWGELPGGGDRSGWPLRRPRPGCKAGLTAHLPRRLGDENWLIPLLTGPAWLYNTTTGISFNYPLRRR